MSRAMKDSGVPWIGDLPNEWQISKLKRCVAIRKRIAGETGRTVLSITQKGIVPKDLTSNEGQIAADYSNYQIVHPGDFAMNHMDLLTGWVDISRFEGVTSPDYRVFELVDKSRWSQRYLLHLLQTCYRSHIFYGLGQGVSGFGRWRLPADMFLHFDIPCPEISEQQRIADFLDVQTQEVDAVIVKTRESIEEYQKLKQSVITQTLTKGIRPGTIFKKTTLGKISVEIQTGPFGSQLHQSDYTKEGIPVVMPKNLVGGIICDVDIARVNMAFVERLAQHKITKGNLLYSRRGEVGRCALASEVNEGWLCGTGCLRVRLNEQVAYPKYVMYQAAEASTMTWIQLHAVGTTMLNINSSILQSVPIEIPAFPEQQEIVAYLDEKCGAIDALIEKKRQIITELESYKKSLIYEYVTGKKEVPA